LIPPLRLNKYSTTIKHRGEMLKKPTNRENVTSPLINYGNNTFYYFLSLPTIAPINNRYWKKILSFIVFLSWHFILSAQIESTYYIPMPEKDIHASFKVFTDAQNFGISNGLNAVISIVATDDNTIIYYDHWEDGYEWNIMNPSKNTTQIWGDNDDSNGKPPGFATDIINAGDVIGLENFVPLPRNASTIYYDGRDKISATAQLAMSRASWAPTPGPVLSGAVEILETSAWGEDFEVPIGENINADGIFDKVSLFVMAKDFLTIVSIDTDGDGNNDITRWLNQGDTYLVKDGIQAGAKITSTRPIQAHLITGDRAGRFENRWFTLFPCELWDNSYFSPVGTTVSSDPVNVFIYNPNNSAIQVQYSTLGSSGSFNVGAKSVYRFVMPIQSGAHFYTTNDLPFFALSTIDSDVQDNDAHDWGFTLVPESYLTVSATLGWGPGSGGNDNQNGSPAWVTAIEPTTVYVDYDGNPATGNNTDLNGNKYNVAYNISAYESLQIYDDNDNDQTGMFIYTLDGTLISAAWGQDPATAAPGNPFLDFGTTVPPIRKISAWKDYELTTDYNGNGLVDQGDIITFTIHIQNAGNAPIYDINLRDTLPWEVTYIANSTRLNNFILVDDNAGSAFPLDETGYDKANLAVNETDIYSFQTQVNNPPPTITTLTNRFTAVVGTPNKILTGEVTVPVVGSTVTVEFCNLDFTDNGGTIQSSYEENQQICITVSDNDQNTDIGSTQMIEVLLFNSSKGDRETVCLTETGNNTGIFRGCINSSSSGGIGVEDGIINAVAGDLLDANFTDPIYGEVCTNTTIIAAPTETKVLYLTAPGQRLDRIDPVATNDVTTSTVIISSSSGSNSSEIVNYTGTGNGVNSNEIKSGTSWGQTFSYTSGNGTYTVEGFSVKLKKDADATAQTITFSIRNSWSGASLATATISSSSLNTSYDWYELNLSSNLDLTDGNTYYLRADNPGSGKVYWLQDGTGSYTGGAATDNSGVLDGSKDFPFIISGVSGGSCDENTAIDDFNTVTFSGGSGWNGNWVELGESDGAGSGDVMVTTDVLIGGDRSWRTQQKQNGSQRAINLNGATCASLEFYYLRDGWDSNDNLIVSISGNNGSTWTELTRINGDGGEDNSWNYYTTEISNTALLTANSVIRFISGNDGEQGGDDFFIDDLRIEWGGGGSGGGTGLATFTQTVPMCSPLELPSGGGLQIINYVNVTSGTMPSNPDITAVLKHDATVFATLSNPVYNNGTGIIEWNTTLGSNYTLPAGDTVKLEITQNDTGYEFDINYDSDTKPSRIELPVTTVIEIEELAIYDAPYPDGNQVQSLENGQTGYIRTTVNDPFGPYDITGLDLNIYPPSNSPINLNLDEADVAGTSGCTKIYEYEWKTSVAQGQFSIEAIAHEGYEGITDSLTMPIEVSFNDLGTSCSVQFLDAGFNPTEQYNENDQICVAVTDIDQNEDTLATETVIITLLGTNDTETLTLSETGINTGVFQACINSHTGVGTSENGQLAAPGGSLISFEYIDPQDSTDICEAVASIITPTPTLQIRKTLMQPTDGTALVGDALQFDILLVNTGSTVITSIALDDVFDNACMNYDSASISPNATGAGTINWTNVGPLNPSESKTVTVYFTASNSCNPAQNTASANGVDENSTPVSAGPVTAEVIITNPLLSISKTLISPASGPYFDTDLLTFQIDITNIGNTNIVTLPLTDEFSAYCLEFQSASISPDDNGSGSLVWNDLGNLNVGNTISLTTQFSVVNACDPAINEAEVAFAIDENGDVVPTVQDDAQVSIESPPVALDDEDETYPGIGVTVSVLDNDYDINNNIHPGSVTTTGVLQPANGTISAINSTTGAITYTPDNSFLGIDTYEYIVCDSTNLCDTALVTITIKANLPPNAVDDYSSTLINTPVDISVLDNDSDPDDGLDTSSISTTGLLAPSNGGVSTNTSNGVITYTPNNGFTGNDNFEYQICDLAGACDTAMVYVLIRPCIESAGQNNITEGWE